MKLKITFHSGESIIVDADDLDNNIIHSKVLSIHIVPPTIGEHIYNLFLVTGMSIMVVSMVYSIIKGFLNA